MLTLLDQPKDNDLAADRKFNRIAGWASIIGLVLAVISIIIGILLFFVIPPTDTVKQLFWSYIGLFLIFAGALALLFVASLKYHRHYKQWHLGIVDIKTTVETIKGLKQTEVADKINNAFSELNTVVALSKNLHYEVSEQLHLLEQITPESRNLVDALADLNHVIPSAKDTVHELKVLTGLFLQNAPEQARQLRGLIYTLGDLTTLESSLPDDSVVVIRRPVDIRAKNNDVLTRIMKLNTDRGIEYSVIGNEMPREWKNIKGIKQIIVNQKDPSLVLPSLGLVLYIVNKAAQGDWKEHYVWYPIESKNLQMGKADIAGFVLLPIPHNDGDLEHGYLALRMSGADIDELIHRIY